jgi:Spy/CpxP family protein refolding chaperone
MLIGSAYGAAAHGPGFGGKGDRLSMHVERMAKVLDLTAAQKEKVSAVLKAEQEKTEPLRQQLYENRKKIMETAFSGKFDETAVRAIAEKQAGIQTELIVSHARAKSEIHGLLTPEQRTLAQKLGPMMMGPGCGHMQRFSDEE